MRRFWDTRPENVCLLSCRHSFADLRTFLRDWILTAACTWCAGYLSRATITPTWYPFPAEPSCTRACSWYTSCGNSSAICSIPIMNRPSPSCIPGSAPTRTPAGSEHIPTASSSTTARSTPSAEMRTTCWPEKRRWNADVSRARCTRCCRSSTWQVLTPPCWTTRWNSCT